MDYWLDEGYKLMPIRDFVGHCLASEGGEPLPGLSGGGYLASHPLLDHVPALEADVLTPDFVHFGAEGHLVRKVFFGPRGTVTPLHFDSYENAFCQVVGTKYMRLYAPTEASNLYARSAGQGLANNSTIEPADILEGEAAGVYGSRGDAAPGRFAKFLDAAYLDVVLEPGDLLYLPKDWWHFVKSLSTSISVAFHFT